jgi:hypothetical protein
MGWCIYIGLVGCGFCRSRRILTTNFVSIDFTDVLGLEDIVELGGVFDILLMV